MEKEKIMNMTLEEHLGCSEQAFSNFKCFFNKICNVVDSCFLLTLQDVDPIRCDWICKVPKPEVGIFWAVFYELHF